MKIRFKDFTIELRAQNVTVEADSIEEAKDKLYRMDADTLMSLVEDEGYIEDVAIRSEELEDYAIVANDYKVHCSDIQYDLEGDGLTPAEQEEVISGLPTEFDVVLTNVDVEDREDAEYFKDLVADELAIQMGQNIKSFTFEVDEGD